MYIHIAVAIAIARATATGLYRYLIKLYMKFCTLLAMNTCIVSYDNIERIAS